MPRKWGRRIFRLGLVLLVGALILNGCGGGRSAVTPTTEAAESMPEWLATAESFIQTEYRWAAEHHNELQYIPCYCGCVTAGHADNFACYFRQETAGAILQYESHAYG